MVDATKGVMTENEDDEDFIIVDTDPNAEPVKDEKPAEPEDEPEDDEDEGDDRLAESQDDHDDDVVNRNREKRQKRKEMQRQARERAERELRLLREQNEVLLRRVSAVENSTLQQTEVALDQQLRAALYEVQQAEGIIAKATDAGNGEDVVTAMRIREAAARKAEHLHNTKQQWAHQRQQANVPQVAPQAQNYAQQWINANPWFDPKGGDEDSAITKAIDNRLAAEGYDPTTPEYWTELTARVARRLGADDVDTETRQAAPRRKAPPTGGQSDHAPATTRKGREVYLSPERKQAMVDAGVWDDPVRRNQMLRAYADYDRNKTAR